MVIIASVLDPAVVFQMNDAVRGNEYILLNKAHEPSGTHYYSMYNTPVDPLIDKKQRKDMIPLIEIPQETWSNHQRKLDNRIKTGMVGKEHIFHSRENIAWSWL